MDRRDYSGKIVNSILLNDAAEEYVQDVSAILEEMQKPKSLRRTPDEVMAARRAKPTCHHTIGPVWERREVYADCDVNPCQCRLDEWVFFVKNGPTQEQVDSHEL